MWAPCHLLVRSSEGGAGGAVDAGVDAGGVGPGGGGVDPPELGLEWTGRWNRVSIEHRW